LSDNVPPKHFIRPIRGSEAFAIPSIADAFRENIPLKNEDTGTKPQTESKSVELQPFTQDQLNHVWKIFVEDIDAPQLKSALSSRLPQLGDDWKIIYELDNELQNQRITLELKPQLLGFLRQNFRNEKIEIEFIITENKDFKPEVPYTESEKWQALAEKYPSLITLKNKFGLDFQ
jgi:DNA polymerase-3 subunit gamma/tau